MTLRIGTRGSALALWQANHVADRLRSLVPDRPIELVKYKTMGDHILDRPLSEIGGKGLFTKELEVGLNEGYIHLAVHSLKDMPTLLPDGLCLGAIPSRGDVRDCVITRATDAASQTDFQPRRVGTASLRRGCLANRRWSDATIEPIRGNVQTRIGRLFSGGSEQVDAVILAMAGVLRLDFPSTMTDVDFAPLNPEQWIPAVGQGALAIECRSDDRDTLDIIASIHDEQTARCTEAERAFLRAVEGDCRIPVGALATADGLILRLRAFIGSPDGESMLVETSLGEDPQALGNAVAQRLLDRGGGDILRRVRADA